ncbi:MAG TPA: amidohydrolase family protein [Solirubrobacteraceae bacterium]|nr:amidohydrolase family protein [Solirubrobacteraceae bacterium]
MIIDHQAHWYPPAYLEALRNRSDYPRSSRADDGGYMLETDPGQVWPVPPRFVDLELQIQDMDEHGIDAMVVSPGAFGGDSSGLPAEEGMAMMRLLNRETASAQRRYPTRIAGLAVLPMHDPDAALEALAEAIELGLRGISLVSNVGQRSIARTGTAPVYAAASRAGLPVFLHPAQRSLAAHAGYSPIVEMGLSWMFDTAAAALALVYEGILDECEDLVVVHPHLGGVLPYVVERVAAQARLVESRARHPLAHYLTTRFYTDSVGLSAAALRLAVDTYGAERVLFGTDFPWLDRRNSLDFVAAAVDEPTSHAILERNTLPGLRWAAERASARPR